MAMRRTAVWPVVVIAGACVVIASPLLLAIAAVVSLLDPRRRRPLRVMALITAYCAYQVAAIVRGVWLWLRSGFGRALTSAESMARHYELVRWFLEGVRSAAERTTAFELQIDGASREAADFLAGSDAPAVVLARHAGAGDSFLIVQELLSRYGRRPRVVMKSALQYDPLVDLFGNRVPNCFIDPNTQDAEAAIASLARGLGRRDALLIFPEGGNFSLARRRRAIAHLAAIGRHTTARKAMRLHNVAPPKLGGVLAALEASPDADIVLIAHVGLADASGPGAFWRSIPLKRPARMCLWLVRRSEVPDSESEVGDWLMGWWRRLDVWVGAGGV
jgi:1-acyl-sn-glycerol-3-phosphate acyltransferase